MITSEIDYLDGEISVQETEPSTIDELKELIGEQAIVDETNANLRYRNKYPRVYKKVSLAIGTAYPKAVKKEETKKDGTVKKVMESDMDHIRAALSGRKDEQDKVIDQPMEDGRNKLIELFNSIAPAEPLYVKGERTGGGGKVSAAALESANLWFSQGDEVVEGKIDIIEANVPGYKVGRDANGVATPESVARGIQALNKHLEAKAKRESAGLLGKV